MVLEETLESPLDSKEIQESIPKEISPWCSLEGLMLKLKLQYFGHLMGKADLFKRPWCWERLRAGGEGDDRVWDGRMASLTQWTWVWVNSENWWWTRRPGMLWFMRLQRFGHDWATELNWTYYNLGHMRRKGFQVYNFTKLQWIIIAQLTANFLSVYKIHLQNHQKSTLIVALSSPDTCLSFD